MRKNLKNEREKAQLMQVDVAKSLAISTRQYQALEAGTSEGSIKVWKKLKKIFGQSIDYLLEQEADTEKEPDGNQCRVGSSERPTR